MILDKARRLARSAGFVAHVLSRTGLLGALSPGGILSFARGARGIKPGPHVALMLHAANKPEKLALTDGERRYTYAELDREANQLAHALVTLGVKPGDRVALMMPNAVEYVVAQQALPRCGATSVQIGYRLKAPEIAYILDNAEPRAVIVHHDYLAEMDAARTKAGGPDSTRVIVTRVPAGRIPDSGESWEKALGRQQVVDGPPRLHGEEVGGVIVYTSGTTGKPKGATRDLKETGFESVADFMAKVGMHHDDRHLCVCPLYHSAAPAFVAMTFLLGGSVYLLDHFDAERALAMIERERITSAFMVPTMLVRINALPPEVRERFDTGSLRWICSGAAPLATETARQFQDLFGPILYNFYGSTETGLVTLAEPSHHVARPGTIGRLLRGNEVRLLGDDGREVANGEVGELYARNSMLIRGYHKNEDATEKSKREGFFSVGDLARTDGDGFYYLESRKHDMVISGGVNIYPREIEDHLHNHPEILEVAVIGIPDAEWGESLKAFVVTRPGARVTAQEVMDFCRGELADFKRPRQVEFLDELPRNPTGKVLKRELRAR